MRYLRVKDYERFQHYKDRNPPWIKLYTALLHDYEFFQLADAHKAHLVMFWLLASRHDNRIPYDEKYLQITLPLTEPLDLEVLIASGFLEEVGENSAGQVPRQGWASRYIPGPVRKDVLAKTGGKCAACGSKNNVEIDHILPISKGGDSSAENLQPLCRKCNRSKRVRNTSYMSEQVATQMPSPETETETDTEKETETTTTAIRQKADESLDVRKSPASWVGRLGDFWNTHVGTVQYGRVGKDLQPMVRLWGEELVASAMANFAKHRRIAVDRGLNGKRPEGWADFVRDFRDFLPGNAVPLAARAAQ